MDTESRLHSLFRSSVRTQQRYCSQWTPVGAEDVQPIVSVTPDAICAQALSVAERRAASRLAAEALRQELRPLYAIHTSQWKRRFPKLV
jgi:hypothetical protein